MAVMGLSILAGCASTPAGSSGYDAFMGDASPTSLSGSRDAVQAAQCFEEVRIMSEGGGSRAEWPIAPNLDAKWLDQFERDRGAPLRQCLGI